MRLHALNTTLVVLLAALCDVQALALPVDGAAAGAVLEARAPPGDGAAGANEANAGSPPNAAATGENKNWIQKAFAKTPYQHWSEAQKAGMLGPMGYGVLKGMEKTNKYLNPSSPAPADKGGAKGGDDGPK